MLCIFHIFVNILQQNTSHSLYLKDTCTIFCFIFAIKNCHTSYIEAITGMDLRCVREYVV